MSVSSGQDSNLRPSGKTGDIMTTIGLTLRVAQRLLAVISILSLGCGAAAAQGGRSVYLPLPFSAERRGIQTTACLRVSEYVYPASRWWADAAGSATPAEQALKAVIAAMRSKDRATLSHLSHPTLGRDPKRFDEQAGAYFQQFAVAELLSIPRGYEFDGFTVFFAKIRLGGRTVFAPMVFAVEDDGSSGFLPYRTDALTYRLVADWFGSRWGPAAADTPAYCTGDDVARATHRIALGVSSGAARPAWHPSLLLLRGASFDRPGALGDLVKRTRAALASLQSTLVSGDIDAAMTHMTSEGGRRLKEWFTTAGQGERRRYGAALAEQHPFFLFDMSSVAVVYTRAPVGVQVLYFTADATTAPLWVNSSFATVWDQVFKKGPLYDAASQRVPFQGIAVK